jgi:hypothetical protein
MNARLPGAVGATVALGGEFVQRQAREVPLFGDALGALPLVDQFVFRLQRRIQRLKAAADVAEHGYAGHILHAGADGVGHVAGGDSLGHEVHGLLAGAAHAVQRDGGHRRWELGQQGRQAPHVGPLLAHLGDAAGDHVFHLSRRQGGSFQQALQNAGQQAVGTHLAIGAVALAKRGADCFQNDCFSHKILQRIKKNRLSLHC